MLKPILLLSGLLLTSGAIATPISNCSPYPVSIDHCQGAIAGTTLPTSPINIPANAVGTIPTSPILTALSCQLTVSQAQHRLATSTFYFYWHNYTIPGFLQQPTNAVMVATLPTHIWICPPGTPEWQCISTCQAS